MSTRRVLVSLIAALALSACAGLESKWRWLGISVEDEAAIKAALRKVSSSPIVNLQPRQEGDLSNKIMFYTADDKIYEAGKYNGKWLIIDVTRVIL